MPYIILGICVAFLCFLVIRTYLFKPKKMSYQKVSHEIDEKRSFESLSQLIQCQTISYEDTSRISEDAFQGLRDLIFERYPEIIKHSSFSMHEKGMLFKIKGTDDLDPVILMSHYDVVPVTDDWDDDPFSGKITETHVYGRGALDTKHSLNAILESVEMMLKQGHTFKHDLYLSFGGDEETYGTSQIAIVEHLKKEAVTPYFVLDEGGAIVSDIFPGVKEKTAVIGIAEKGFLNIKLSAKSQGGHASTPPQDTPLTMLSDAVHKLNRHALPLKLTKPVRLLFESVAPYSKSKVIRFLFANIFLFLPLIKLIAKLSGGQFKALFQTSQAFTMMKGSDAINVLPSEASISINYRMIPGETSDDIIARIKHIIKDDRIDVSIHEVTEASTVSLVDDRYNIVEKAIHQTWPDVIVAPYLMIATSDSRRYHQISSHVYKFSPMDVSDDDLAKIHGINEDISKENVIQGINFYLNLLSTL